MKDGAPEILVVGAGAIGVYFSGRLAQAGAKVSVVARADYDALRRNGGVYKIRGAHGDFDFKPERVLKNVSEAPSNPDFILVALKVLPGVSPVELCRPAVGPDSSFLVIQNGLGSDAALAAAYPKNEVIGAIAYIGASRPEPGVVRQQDSCSITMGVHPKGSSPKLELLHSLLKKSGVDAKTSGDIVEARWSKLLWNGPYNPISALTRSDTKAIMELTESARLAEEIMKEVSAIAKAAGHPLEPALIEKNLSFTRGMSPYKTSMLQDLEAGRPLEIEALLGQPLKVAELYGVKAPAMSSLYALLKLMVRK